MKVLIFDKSNAVRKIIRNIILKIFSYSQIQDTDKPEELLCRVNEQRYDLVILDIDSITDNLIKLIAGVRSQNPSVAIVVLTHFPENRIKEKLSDRGINYYLDKITQQNNLIEIIRSIHVTNLKQNNYYKSEEIYSASSV